MIQNSEESQNEGLNLDALIGQIVISLRPEFNEWLQNELANEIDTGKWTFKGYAYFGLAIGYYYEMRLAEVKVCLEQAIRDDKKQFGDPQHRKHSAWQMYVILFGDEEDKIHKRIGQVIEEGAREIPAIKREMVAMKKRVMKLEKE